MTVATLGALGQSAAAAYSPMSDPTNPCYQPPSAYGGGDFVGPPISAACNAWLNQHGTVKIQWKGKPTGYNPTSDPTNPCYQSPSAYGGDFGPSVSPACNAWMQQYGMTTLSYTGTTPGSGGATTTSTNPLSQMVTLGTMQVPVIALIGGAALVLLLVMNQ